MKISEFTIPTFEKTCNVSLFTNVKMTRSLPYEKQLEFLQDVLTRSLDDNGYYTPLAVELYIALDIIHFYTDIDIADGTPVATIYDIITSSGLLNAVISGIREGELELLRKSIYDTIDNIYKYRNSAYAILSSLQDTEGLEDKITDLVSKLKSAPEGLDLVKAAVDKLG